MGIFDLFVGLCDLDLDPMTFIYELVPLSPEIPALASPVTVTVTRGWPVVTSGLKIA